MSFFHSSVVPQFSQKYDERLDYVARVVVDEWWCVEEKEGKVEESAEVDISLIHRSSIARYSTIPYISRIISSSSLPFIQTFYYSLTMNKNKYASILKGV